MRPQAHSLINGVSLTKREEPFSFTLCGFSDKLGKIGGDLIRPFAKDSPYSRAVDEVVFQPLSRLLPLP